MTTTTSLCRGHYMNLTNKDLRNIFIAVNLRAEAAYENSHLSKSDRAEFNKWETLLGKIQKEITKQLFEEKK